MNEPAAQPSAPRRAWPDAMAAAAVLAVDPSGIGGVLLHARPGPARESWLERLAELLPPGTRTKRMPLHIDDARLLGGLDLAATLHAGRPVAQRGLLSEADGGVLIVAMAERLGASAAAQLAAALDTHEVALQRDGLAQRHAARFGVVALDEGDGDEERMPAALADRLALHVDLSEVGWRETLSALDGWNADDVRAARERLPRVDASSEIVEALCAAALALGVYSLRAPLFALRVAQIAAALGGREAVSTEDAALAARWVLAPRATQVPAAPQEPPAEEAEPPEPQAEQRANEQPADGSTDPSSDADETEKAPVTPDQPLEDVVLEAAQAAIPAGLLERLIALGRAQPATPSSGRAGAVQFSRLRGRPLGARRGEPRSGARLDLIATLRTAAPWQTLRRRERALLPLREEEGVQASAPRIEVRREDFHVTRYQQRRATTTVFVVDASGSAALHRLAEAKGAVELLLADCYVRRDSVAVIAFRGPSAEVLLPPTRSLVRAKRSLAGLPGGGGTPLAAGIDAAVALAEVIRRRGDTPVLVLLTDGRGNITRDGKPGRVQATQDALAAARRLRAQGAAVLLLDTSPQPQEQGQLLADAMGARYLPLPHAGSAAMSAAARAVGR